MDLRKEGTQIPLHSYLNLLSLVSLPRLQYNLKSTTDVHSVRLKRQGVRFNLKIIGHNYSESGILYLFTNSVGYRKQVNTFDVLNRWKWKMFLTSNEISICSLYIYFIWV